MADDGLRRDNRNDPVAQAIAADPDIAAAISRARKDKAQRSISDAIQRTDNKMLIAWAAVAIWEDEDGNVTHSLIGDQHSASHDLAGYLSEGLQARLS